MRKYVFLWNIIILFHLVFFSYIYFQMLDKRCLVGITFFYAERQESVRKKNLLKYYSCVLSSERWRRQCQWCWCCWYGTGDYVTGRVSEKRWNRNQIEIIFNYYDQSVQSLEDVYVVSVCRFKVMTECLLNKT